MSSPAAIIYVRISTRHSSAWSPIFPHVDDSEDEDIGIGYLVASFIVSHRNSAYFARLELRQSSSQRGVSGNSFRARDPLANDTNRNGAVDGMQKFVKANKVRARAALKTSP